MVTAGNITKFFEDHPELADRKEVVLGKMYKLIGGQEIIASMLAEVIMGDLWDQFIAETTMSKEQKQIFGKACNDRRISVKSIDQLCEGTGKPRESWKKILSGKVDEALEMEEDFQL